MLPLLGVSGAKFLGPASTPHQLCEVGWSSLHSARLSTWSLTVSLARCEEECKGSAWGSTTVSDDDDDKRGKAHLLSPVPHLPTTNLCAHQARQSRWWSLKWPALPVSRSCRFLVCLGRVHQLLDSACSCRRQLECLSGQPHALPGASAVLRGPVLSAPWLVLTAQPPSTPFIPVPSAQHRSGPPAARSPLLVPSCPAPGTASISRMAVFN